MTAIAKVRETLESEALRKQLAVLLPPHISAEKFVSVAMTAVIRNEELLDADRTSLMTACADCARDGLLPDGKEAAFVVHNTKRKVLQANGGRTEITVLEVSYMPMVRGIYKLSNGSGDVSRLRAHLVHENDEFHYELGLDPVCKHTPAKSDQGAVTHVYATVHYKDGQRDLEVMTKEDVEIVRAMSKQPNGRMWTKSWGEGAKKTVIHRIAKRLDLEPDVSKAIERIEGDYDFGGALSAFEPDALPPPRPTPEIDAPTLDPQAEKIARDIATMGTERLVAHFSQMPPEQVALLAPIKKELDAIATEVDLKNG